jgi:hypothetical protein
LRTHDDSDVFWDCFRDSYDMNPKGINGKTRTLSIIAERFTYEEIINKLGVIICLFSNTKCGNYINSPYII